MSPLFTKSPTCTDHLHTMRHNPRNTPILPRHHWREGVGSTVDVFPSDYDSHQASLRVKVVYQITDFHSFCPSCAKLSSFGSMWLPFVSLFILRSPSTHYTNKVPYVQPLDHFRFACQVRCACHQRVPSSRIPSCRFSATLQSKEQCLLAVPNACDIHWVALSNPLLALITSTRCATIQAVRPSFQCTRGKRPWVETCQPTIIPNSPTRELRLFTKSPTFITMRSPFVRQRSKSRVRAQLHRPYLRRCE